MRKDTKKKGNYKENGRKNLFPVLIPPSGGGIAGGVDLGHDSLVVLLVDSHRIATALEEDDEIEAACNIGGTLVHAEELAEEVVELLLGLGLEELEKHAGRGLLKDHGTCVMSVMSVMCH